MRNLIDMTTTITSMESGALLGWAALGTLVVAALVGIARLLDIAVDACGNWEEE